MNRKYEHTISVNRRCGIDGRELMKGHMTGIGRFLSSFIRYAPEIKPDWEFLVFGNQDTFFPGTFPHIKEIIIPQQSTLLWDQVQLPRALKRERIDIFFSPHYKTPFCSPCPTVTTIHDIIPFLRLSGTATPELGPKHALLESWSRIHAYKSTRIITVSHHSKKDIIDLYGIPDHKISVVYEGAGEEFKPCPKDKVGIVKKQYGIKGDYLLYIGNLKPHKNVEGILKSYAGLNNALKEKYRLVIGGKLNCNFMNIKNLCCRLGIEGNTQFTGFIENNDLPALYSGAALFVFPSFYEGFGLPPLEAMACGTPVISSGVTSLHEIFDQAAFFIDPGNPGDITESLERTLTDEKLRKGLREKGLHRARFFSLKRMSAEIINVLEKSIVNQ